MFAVPGPISSLEYGYLHLIKNKRSGAAVRNSQSLKVTTLSLENQTGCPSPVDGAFADSEKMFRTTKYHTGTY